MAPRQISEITLPESKTPAACGALEFPIQQVVRALTAAVMGESQARIDRHLQVSEQMGDSPIRRSSLPAMSRALRLSCNPLVRVSHPTSRCPKPVPSTRKSGPTPLFMQRKTSLHLRSMSQPMPLPARRSTLRLRKPRESGTSCSACPHYTRLPGEQLHRRKIDLHIMPLMCSTSDNNFPVAHDVDLTFFPVMYMYDTSMSVYAAQS